MILGPLFFKYFYSKSWIHKVGRERADTANKIKTGRNTILG